MTRTIAIAGKGGTGKTTFAALLVQLLAQKGSTLAVDADPSVNLHLALGLPAPETVGEVREEMLSQVRSGRFAAGMAKQDYLDLRLNEALVESREVDLIAMGRPEGPGCYCPANHMLRTAIDRLAGAYEYVIIDNEAGMEHISRQTTRDVDILFLLSDPSVRGIIAAGRMQTLIGELRTQVGQVGLVVNRVNGALSKELMAAIAQHRLKLWALLPADDLVTQLDAAGKPLRELPAHSPLRQAMAALAQKVGLV